MHPPDRHEHDPTGPALITGWKAIAKHIGVGTERTARKWVRKYGLPVHYTPDGHPILSIDACAIWWQELNKSK